MIQNNGFLSLNNKSRFQVLIIKHAHLFIQPQALSTQSTTDKVKFLSIFQNGMKMKRKFEFFFQIPIIWSVTMESSKRERVFNFHLTLWCLSTKQVFSNISALSFILHTSYIQICLVNLRKYNKDGSVTQKRNMLQFLILSSLQWNKKHIKNKNICPQPNNK